MSDEVDVVIVGGGPTGLMLACELRLGGARPLLLERLDLPDEHPKANGLVGQVVRLTDHRGLYRQLAAGGPWWQRRSAPSPSPAFMFGGFRLDLRGLGDHPLSILPVPQQRLERVLADRARELGAEVRRGHEATGFTQDADGVTIKIQGPHDEYAVRAPYLVGCDGAHSRIRKLAGIGFPGETTQDHVSRNAHVVLPRSVLTRTGGLRAGGRLLRPYLFHRTPHGVFSFAPFRDGLHLVNTYEWGDAPVDDETPMSVAELAASLRRVLGDEIELRAPTTAGRHVLRRVTTRNSRVAEHYRAGRVFLAGDAAHVLTGFGGPGLNLALPDAVNLGWKLAAAARGTAPTGLLDSYHTERRPLAERVLAQLREQSSLLAPGAATDARRVAFTRRLTDPAFRRGLAETIAGADLPYDMGGMMGEVPLVGRLAPELPLVVAGRRTRLGVLLRRARPILLDLTGGPGLADAARELGDRGDHVVARCSRPAPAAMLIRPDGWVAWAGDGDGEGLRAALAAWCG
ncbi:2-polyprenyl-6-methoxyphenol hydroxylase-like FAD-dependent oxidoreductase [Allocatelliglobosispora scoriae]|uniref:2-polyprenyl-6-methoxyphenol hydroxylase-like FAD-dependent oxidoreductase n=1 Tax=Allocatelliglobosispora scoriae TaxID=643052 RepID=A0A841BXT9_9ACTN|nr:FAD-dependent oxidoreductase [Allocatelliglobosispora scoriae]MBB5871592.1 2-polyprenyl-6-methoxyphenol hydroxylase-like FAD-dependent oxidoreductase [Allocatelliglobosispora scoriae]